MRLRVLGLGMLVGVLVCLLPARAAATPRKEAIGAYRKAVSLNPKLVATIRDAAIRAELRETFLAEARRSKQEGRLPEAERSYLLAGNFGDDFALFMELGQVYLQMEAWSKAVVVFKKAIVANPGNPTAIASLATAYHKAGHEGVAAQFFARALSMEPALMDRIQLPADLRSKVREEIVNKARALLGREMPLDAATKMELALSMAEDAPLRLEQARAYLTAGDRQAAARAVARAVDLRGDLFEQVPAAHRKPTAAILYAEAVGAFQAKDLPRARHLFERSLSLDETARTLYNLGNVYVHASKLDRAVELYRKAIGMDASLDEARLNLAMVQIEKGLYQNAIRDLKGLIAQNPRRSEAYDLIAQAYSLLNQPTKALRVYQAAVNFDLELADKLTHQDVRQAAALAFFQDARESFDARDFQHVVELCGKANALHPRARTYYLLGNARFAMDDALGAIPAYEEALALAPDHAPTLNNMGNAYLKLKDYPRAAETFHRATEARPDYAQAFNNLGIALRKAGELDQAIEAYQQALAIDPDYAAAYFNLGNAYQEIKGS